MRRCGSVSPSALFGLSHDVISRAQYSALVAAVVASAVVPTLIANAFFLPRHLIDSSKQLAPVALAATGGKESGA